MNIPLPNIGLGEDDIGPYYAVQWDNTTCYIEMYFRPELGLEWHIECDGHKYGSYDGQYAVGVFPPELLSVLIGMLKEYEEDCEE